MTKAIVSPPAPAAQTALQHVISREQILICRDALYDAFNTLLSLSTAATMFPSGDLVAPGEIDTSIAIDSFVAFAEKRLNIILHIFDDYLTKTAGDEQ